MAIYETRKHFVFPYIKGHIDFLYASRKGLRKDQKFEKIGINYSIILYSACLIEGQLENDLKNLADHRRRIFYKIEEEDFYKRRIKNVVTKNLFEFNNDMIAKTTGIGNFENVFRLFSHKRIPSKYSDFNNWEGTKVLFNFRNVLAHGREIRAMRIKAFWTDNNWDSDFKGGYRLVSDYLIKQKIIKKSLIENGSPQSLFTNKVADHFYSIAKRFIKFHSKLIEQEMTKFSISNYKYA